MPSRPLLALTALLAAASMPPAPAQRPRAPAAPADAVAYLPPTPEAYRRFAGEIEAMLQQDVLGVWFPRSLDTVHGGFYSDFARNSSPLPSRGKFSVFQGRMTWVAAQVVLRRPAQAEQYRPYVEHGAKYLRDTLWDRQYGGFFWGLNDDGSISPAFTDNKQLYGISFAIYGLAGAFQATHDPKDLALAKTAFRWTDRHAHDAAHGGYYEWLRRDGTPLQADHFDPQVHALPGTDFPVGYKSMNTHIHLLESFTELLKIWPDPILRARVAELQRLVRDVIVVPPGCMNLYLTNDWHAVPDHDSYGHDVEATYLLDEAAQTLHSVGRPVPSKANDALTAEVGRMLMNHALLYGWDKAHGGLYRSGSFDGPPADLLKEWWVQMESLNTLLLLHERHGAEDARYWQAFQLQWHWIRQYQVDHVFHGEYELIKPDDMPLSTVKGRIWKAGYHEARALMNVRERLDRLASAPRQARP